MTTYLQDSFERSVSSGLGTADVGGSWIVSATGSIFSVTGTEARITCTQNTTRTALANASNQSGTFVARVKFRPAFMPGSGQVDEVGLILRNSSSTSVANHYSVNAVYNSSGDTQVRVRQGATTLSTSSYVGTVVNTTDYFWLAVAVTTNSVSGQHTFQIKTWKVGESEPDWQHSYARTDASYSQGYAGLRIQRGTGGQTNAAFYFDELFVGDAFPADSEHHDGAATFAVTSGLAVNTEPHTGSAATLATSLGLDVGTSPDLSGLVDVATTLDLALDSTPDLADETALLVDLDLASDGSPGVENQAALGLDVDLSADGSLSASEDVEVSLDLGVGIDAQAGLSEDVAVSVTLSPEVLAHASFSEDVGLTITPSLSISTQAGEDYFDAVALPLTLSMGLVEQVAVTAAVTTTVAVEALATAAIETGVAVVFPIGVSLTGFSGSPDNDLILGEASQPDLGFGTVHDPLVLDAAKQALLAFSEGKQELTLATPTGENLTFSTPRRAR